jgi:glycerophosphoryl diester phosphodiesterase
VRPENTLPSFEHALLLGVDAIELDVLVSADDRVVVGHDPVLDPRICLGARGERIPPDSLIVRALSFDELRRFDVGAQVHPRFVAQRPAPQARMPSLDEVLERVRPHRETRLLIELKSVPGRPELQPPPLAFADRVLEAVARAGMFERCVLMSFDHRTLVAAKILAPAVTTAALTSDNRIDFVAVALSVGAEIVAPHKDWVTEPDVAHLHDAGRRVIVWTANEPAEWQRLVEMGVDGIITDDPGRLISWRKASLPDLGGGTLER